MFEPRLVADMFSEERARYLAPLYDNNLAAPTIAGIAARLIEATGGQNDDWPYLLELAAKGCCAAEIARAYVRSHRPLFRRQRLSALTKFGAAKSPLG